MKVLTLFLLVAWIVAVHRRARGGFVVAYSIGKLVVAKLIEHSSSTDASYLHYYIDSEDGYSESRDSCDEALGDLYYLLIGE